MSFADDVGNYAKGALGLDAQKQQGRGDKMAKEAREYYAAQAELAKQQGAIGQEQYDWYKSQIQPRYEQELDSAFDEKKLKQEVGRERGRAGADYAQSQERQRGIQTRRAAAMGVDPADVMRRSTGDEARSVAGRANAVTQTGYRTRRMQEQRRMGYLQPGLGKSSEGTQTMSQAGQGFGSAGAGSGGLAGQQYANANASYGRFQNAVESGAMAAFAYEGGSVSAPPAGSGSDWKSKVAAGAKAHKEGQEANQGKYDFAQQAWFDKSTAAEGGDVHSGYAAGGDVDGQGGPVDDANYIRISNREIVIPVQMRDYFGDRHFDKMFKTYQKATEQEVTGMPKVTASPTAPVPGMPPGEEYPDMAHGGEYPGMARGGFLRGMSGRGGQARPAQAKPQQGYGGGMQRGPMRQMGAPGAGGQAKPQQMPGYGGMNQSQGRMKPMMRQMGGRGQPPRAKPANMASPARGNVGQQQSGYGGNYA